MLFHPDSTGQFSPLGSMHYAPVTTSSLSSSTSSSLSSSVSSSFSSFSLRMEDSPSRPSKFRKAASKFKIFKRTRRAAHPSITPFSELLRQSGQTVARETTEFNDPPSPQSDRPLTPEERMSFESFLFPPRIGDLPPAYNEKAERKRKKVIQREERLRNFHDELRSMGL
ncbi:hypothetical protein BT69DRAFT_1353350 [Atractiella rhizophila]|nr:hypothetical protein BT69DRAFT_1353350 [Atractiella rhizophila]